MKKTLKIVATILVVILCYFMACYISQDDSRFVEYNTPKKATVLRTKKGNGCL